MCLTTCAILAAVWVSTTNHTKTQITKDLELGQRIFTQVLANREKQLYDSADVLTADFGFKQSVASQDKATITSVLYNHGERISANLMALLSLDGIVISSTSDTLNSNEPFPAEELIATTKNDGGVVSILEIDNKLYQVILLTVDAPTPIAIAVVGFEINQTLIEELATFTKLHITIELRYTSGEKIAISSLPEIELDGIYESATQELEILRSPFDQESKFISKRFLVSELIDSQVWIILSEDLNKLLTDFNALYLEITFITLFSIGMALLTGAVFAKNLTLPLTNLVAMAQRIACGDYDKDIATEANSQEINNLAVAFSAMQKNIRKREEEIQYQASHDLTTNLYNRYQIAEIIQHKMAKNYPFQVFGMNILGFRGINDTFGYHTGDACLQLFAARLNELGGQSARLNGGELLWLPDQPISEFLLLKFRQQLEQSLHVNNTILNVKLAIGLVCFPKDVIDAQEVFRRVSIAVEHARQQENLYQAYHKELEESYLYRLEVLAELKQALSSCESELGVHYQPKLNLHTGRVSQVEALMRWRSKKLGFVSPELFIPIAEQAGLIHQVTEWVINRVIRDISRWKQDGIHLQVAVNLSSHDVANNHLLPSIV
ncbi:MAG: EAL domain-containing protein, partial [Nitrosomonas sp.]|nr:EAL domain-containing protein [Nitrosomonas sp.]